VPIGWPIANTRLYLLDLTLRPVPLGAPGQLFVGGCGLARGYVGHPALTADRFLPDPFSGDSGARLYRTGDVARRLADGALEYLGRVDRQVKLRGYRVELGEVEAALLRQEGVREAAAEVEGGRVVGYVACGAGWGGEAWAREALGRELPAYMVPWRVVALERLPLTANGKVDREALRGSGVKGEGGVKYEEPETEVERGVAEVWREVLGLERVGRGEDFFEAGGHSLLATQVISRLRDVLGLDVSVHELFEHSTLADFARHIETVSRAARDLQSPVGVASDGRDEGEL
jgi:hypothetical protein